MAMLAEPRQKKKYLLAPKGKPLYEDENRFGTRMLEKMGWSKRRGLGRNEDGAKDFVRVRYKNDVEGFGYKEQDDQWTNHDVEFNGLLKSLNNGIQEANVTNEGNNVETFSIISGESLEEKSKNSKVRVHYKKFTRGKDLTLYSKKDLANIFGKKPEEIEVSTNNYNETSRVTDVVNSDKEKIEVETPNHSLQTINTGLTVSEYFKQKMEQLRTKSSGTAESEKETLISNADGEADIYEAVTNRSSKKKRDKLKKSEEFPEQIAKFNDSERKDSVENEALIKEEIESIAELSRTEPIPKIESAKISKKLKKLKTMQTKLAKAKNELMDECDVTMSDSRENNHSLIDTTPDIITCTKNFDTKKAPNCCVGIKNDMNIVPSEETLTRQCTFPNIYRISSFCAEKFRYADLNRFEGSNISEIIGYGLSEDLKLDIKIVKEDEQRINQFWSCTLNKYANSRPKRAYKQYVKQAYRALKGKKRIPRLKVKSFKRKHVFGGIL